MKKFLEEYGYAILGVAIVICLVAIVTPVGKNVKTQMTGVIGNFAQKISDKLDTSLNSVDTESLNDSNDMGGSTTDVGSKSNTLSLGNGAAFDHASSKPSSITITFDDDMTWSQWLASDYNTVSFDVTYSLENYIGDDTPGNEMRQVTWNETAHFELVNYNSAIRLKRTITAVDEKFSDNTPTAGYTSVISTVGSVEYYGTDEGAVTSRTHDEFQDKTWISLGETISASETYYLGED